MKAGNVKCGGFLTEDSIKSGRARLVILTSDMSERESKEFKNMCDYRRIPFIVHGTREELGECTGKGFIAAAAVLDEKLSVGILKKYRNLMEVDHGKNESI